MKVHLTNQEFTEHLLGAAQSAPTEHLASCAECREEAARVARALGAFKSWAHEESAKQQSVNVLAVAVSQRKYVSRRLFAWGATAITVIFAAALILAFGARHVTAPTNTPGQVAGNNTGTQVVQPQQSISDEKLLAEVQAALDSSVPRALEPAAALASERNKIIQEKETRNQ